MNKREDPWKDVRFESPRDKRAKGGPGVFITILLMCALFGTGVGAVAGWFFFSESQSFQAGQYNSYIAETMTAEELREAGLGKWIVGFGIVGGIGGASLAFKYWPRD